MGNGGGAFKFEANPEITIRGFTEGKRQKHKTHWSKVKRGSGSSEPGEEESLEVQKFIRIHNEGVGGLPDSGSE